MQLTAFGFFLFFFLFFSQHNHVSHEEAPLVFTGVSLLNPDCLRCYVVNRSHLEDLAALGITLG